MIAAGQEPKTLRRNKERFALVDFSLKNFPIGWDIDVVCKTSPVIYLFSCVILQTVWGHYYYYFMLSSVNWYFIYYETKYSLAIQK